MLSSLTDRIDIVATIESTIALGNLNAKDIYKKISKTHKYSRNDIYNILINFTGKRWDYIKLEKNNRQYFIIVKD